MAILAERLFSFYHGQELAADPKIFLAGVVELFCAYPENVVLKAVSAVSGLPAKYKFPPRLAEIKEFLDGIVPAELPRVYPLLPPANMRPAFERKPHHKTYGEFLDMAARGEVKQRPIGFFEK